MAGVPRGHLLSKIPLLVQIYGKLEITREEVVLFQLLRRRQLVQQIITENGYNFEHLFLLI